MPSSPTYQRDYKQEQTTADARGERPKNIERKRARRLMVSKGLVKPNDGKDVDHKIPLSEGGAKSGGKVATNLRARGASANRSFARNADGSMKK